MPMPATPHSLPTVLLTALCSALSAQTPTTGMPDPVPTSAATRPLVDVAADGTIWARGRDWKASFAPHAVQFVPFLGSDAPRNYPLTMQWLGATAGGVPLVEPDTPTATTDSTRITIARAACTEVYDLARDHVEQSFVFAAAPRSGALQVRLRLTTELVAAPAADGGLCFANARGGVRYGRATAIDAACRQCEVARTLDGDVLTLTVPAAFVAAATWPLTIDPLVTTFAVLPGIGAPSTWNADVAHCGTSTGLTAIVHEEIFSATDHDVFVTGYESDGSIGATAYVDFTTTSWYTPQIASHRGASQFLVVATRSGLVTSIGGRTLAYAHAAATTLTPGAQFTIASGPCANPDVGGDPNPSPGLPGNYCVTWQGGVLSGVYYNVVRTDTTLLTSAGTLLNPGFPASGNPAVSKSCGVGAANMREWIVVWQYPYSTTDDDVYGSRIAGNGAVLTGAFPIATSTRSETHPEVSSLTDFLDGAERYVAVYEQTQPPVGPLPARQRICGQLFTATTPLTGEVDLSQFLATDPLGDQLEPCVDTDGTRFVVGFTEDPAILSPDVVPYVATLHVINDSFGYTELPVALSSYSGPDEHVQITSDRSGGTFTPRYTATWHTTALPSGATAVRGAYYMAHLALGPTSYFAEQFPSCGAAQLTATGLPALANLFDLDLTGASGIPVVLFGNWIAPTNVCASCQLGVDPATMLLLPGTHVTVFVPQQAALIGQQFGAQGLDLLAANGCATPLAFTLSNMILITLL